MNDLKKRPSFGQNTNLGSLYSCQNEYVLADDNVFQSQPPAEFIVKNKFTDSDSKTEAITFESTTSKKLSLLNIEDDAKLSVLCGIATSDAIKFLNHEELGNSRTCFYAQTFKMSYQSLDISDINLQNLCKKKIESNKTDHVIVGITYGNQIIVKLTFNSSAKDVDEIELRDKINKDFDNLLQLSAIGAIENYDQWFTYLSNIKFEVYSDLLMGNSESKTIEEFCNNFQQLKVDMKNAENVKQLYFHLMPITAFQEKMGCEFSETPIFNSIKEKIMAKTIEPAFDGFDDAVSQLYLLKIHLENYQNYVTLKELDSLKERNTSFDAENEEFKRQLMDEVVNYRLSDDSEETDIIVLCRNFSKKCEKTKQEIIKEFDIVKQRTNFLNQIAKLGLTIVRNMSEFEYIKHEKKEIYLLSFAFSQFNQRPELEQNYSYFCSLYNDRKHQNPVGTSPKTSSPHHLYPSFLVVEYDIFPEIFQAENLSKEPQISKIVDGKYAETNLLGNKKILESQCIAKCDNVISTSSNSQNYKRQIVKFRCPNVFNLGKCSNIPHYWCCSKCCAPLEYGFDERFYCICGFQNCEQFEFKCNEKNHKNGFVKFDKKDLKLELSNTSEREVINILMLGESGVGKSTFINSFAMYLTFDTLEEAKSPGSNLIALVPTKFSFQESSNGEDFSIPVSTGSSKNECQEIGKSATRTCRAYHIPYGDKLIRIIDSPGILDTEGMEQDKKNLENILNFLDKYDEIHAICILCRANCVKLSNSFEYCFKELFTQFHISAVKNFVFIFTNAAQSGYQAGDTINYIDKLMEEIKSKRPDQTFDAKAKGRAFNFDNMGYRYLCALQENRTLKIDQEAKYTESYRRARDEAIRLIQHVKTTKPHNAADSVSIFRARNLTFRLTKPLIKIGQTQKESIIKRQRRQREIQKAAGDLEKLRKILATKAPTIHWSLVKETVDVCAHCSTVKEYRGKERNQFLECVPHACDTDPFLLQVYHRLKKTDNGKLECEKCGPLYIYHQIHKYLQCEEVYDTKDIETTIAKKLTTKEEIEQQIKQESKELSEIEEEIKVVISSTAKFYSYLKEESVVSHNDAAEKYIDVLIKCEENGKCDSDKLQSLNDLKHMFQKEKERLDEVSPTSKEKLHRVTPEDVVNLVTKLQDLKHYGPDVKRAMEEKIEKMDAITDEPYISYLNQYLHNKNKIKHCIEELEKQ